MVRTLQQSIAFPTPPATLYALYMDSRKHADATGSPARIGKKVGDAFDAWDGYITGRNLALVPKRLVVQSWRAADWDDDAPDSTFILAFRDGAKPGSGIVDMVHTGVPDALADDLDQGWKDNYWTPWRAYLRAQKR